MKVMRKLYRILSRQTHEGGCPSISVPRNLTRKKGLLMPLNSGETDAA